MIDRKKRKELGLCVSCNKPPINNTTTCEAHSWKMRVKSKKERGLCSKCNNPAIPNETRCEFHSEQNRQISKKIFQNRKETNSCIMCGVELGNKEDITSQFTCIACTYKREEYDRLKRSGW